MVDSLGAHTHQFEDVVRRKGKRVRYQCSVCKRIGPWIKFVDEADVPEPSDDYDAFTVPELMAKCKERGMTGYSKRKRADLIEMLRGAA